MLGCDAVIGSPIGDTELMQAYTVGSGIVIESGRLLLVQNKRRNGSHDWSTPGGVVDPGESVLEALTREVTEETALVVTGWTSMLYVVEAQFARRDITLRAEVYRAEAFDGDLAIDDPDNVVVDGRWVDHSEVGSLLTTSPRWVAEPLQHALAMLLVDGDPDGYSPSPSASQSSSPATWRYTVDEPPVGAGADPIKLRRGRSELHVVRVDGPGDAR